MAAWAKELLPPKRHYIGLTPALSPLYIQETATGIDSAHANLFQRGLMGISAPPGTSSAAVKLAADFTALLGAVPYFVDLAEIDGLMATAHLLPQLAAAALINATIDQPGWSDIRKMAGRPFAVSTVVVESKEEIASLSEVALRNRENSIRVLDSLLTAIQDLRDDLACEDKKSLSKRLEHARQGREKWWQERSRADWLAVEYGKQEMPTAAGILKQQIGRLDKLFGPRRGREKKSDAD